MFELLIAVIIALFVAMLFVNIYFRVRVFKLYKVLVQNKVEFGARHILNEQKMREEVVPRYPHVEKEVLEFGKQIRRSLNMASVLIVLITAFGAVLMYFR